MSVFDISLLTLKWLIGISIGAFTFVIGLGLIIAIIKGIAEGISG